MSRVRHGDVRLWHRSATAPRGRAEETQLVPEASRLRDGPVASGEIGQLPSSQRRFRNGQAHGSSVRCRRQLPGSTELHIDRALRPPGQHPCQTSSLRRTRRRRGLTSRS
jgi:hypothetical protein